MPTVHINQALSSSSLSRADTALAITIAEGVEFDTIAREWRCKWSPDGEKASLVALQKALETVTPEIKTVDGLKSIERVVCGGCLDFKVITSLTADKFGDWEKNEFAPEKEFLEMLKDIKGVSVIETQTYTVRVFPMFNVCAVVFRFLVDLCNSCTYLTFVQHLQMQKMPVV